MAIGKGAQKEILEQIKMVGVNNIVITPLQEESENSAESNDTKKPEKKKYSPGLTLGDALAIETVLPNVSGISPEVSISSYVLLNGKRKNAKITGTNTTYFRLFNLALSEGNYFSEAQENEGIGVCIIGANLKTQLFTDQGPLNKYIKCGNIWLKIIGVLAKTTTRASEAGMKGAITINDGVFVPSKTLLMRYQNRALITTKKLQQRRSNQPSNYNQLDKIIVQVKESEQLSSTSDVLHRMMLRRHNEVADFEIVVPELLLKQQEKTKSIFNIVLGVIAGISLLVGGIGIMNIMFASVMERIREIGVRLSLGAKKADIVVQFLSEAIMISVTGGVIGVILGILGSFLITRIAGIQTIVSLPSVLIAFIVSASVGVIFGYYPAKNASEKDPIESLRYE